MSNDSSMSDVSDLSGLCDDTSDSESEKSDAGNMMDDWTGTSVVLVGEDQEKATFCRCIS